MKKFLIIFVTLIMIVVSIPVNANDVGTGKTVFEELDLRNGKLEELIKDETISYSTTSLKFKNVWIDDISPLTDLIYLEQLVFDAPINANIVLDLTPIKKSEKLEGIEISAFTINDVTPLSNLKSLNTIAIVIGELSDVSSLSQIPNLRSLTLQCNQISDITQFFEFTNLTELDLLYNPLSLTQINQLQKTLPNCTIYHDATGIGCDGCTKLPDYCICLPCPSCQDNGEHCTNCCKLHICTTCNPITQPICDCNKNNCTPEIAFKKGHVLGNDETSIADALEILMHLSGMNGVISNCDNAYDAACIMSDKPTISDALQIMMKLAGMESLVE